jgi:hypothetical protein
MSQAVFAGVLQVMKGPSSLAIAIGAMAAAGTGRAAVIAALAADLGLGQVLDAVDALGGVGSIFAGSWHGASPGRKEVPPGNTSPMAIYSPIPPENFFPRYRLQNHVGFFLEKQSGAWFIEPPSARY